MSGRLSGKERVSGGNEVSQRPAQRLPPLTGCATGMSWQVDPTQMQLSDVPQVTATSGLLSRRTVRLKSIDHGESR